MKKTLVMSVALVLMAGVAHAQVGYGGQNRSGDYAPGFGPNASQGEVLGASTVSPEIQAQIDAIKAQLRILIAQLIELLQQQLAGMNAGGSY